MSRIRRAHEIASAKHPRKKTGVNYNPILGRDMTELETRQQKIVVALFLLLGKAYDLLTQAQRSKVTCLESDIARAWAAKESPVRVISEQQAPEYASWDSESAAWGGERRYSVQVGTLNLGNVAKGFASVPMPKADPVEKEKPDKSRIFTLE